MTMPDTPELPPTDLRPAAEAARQAYFGAGRHGHPAWESLVPDARITWERVASAAILADRATRLAAAQQGWVLVPVEATEAMTEAACREFSKTMRGVYLPTVAMRVAWDAMLDAAPAASSPEAADERASAARDELIAVLEWALLRIRTSLDTGDRYEYAMSVLESAKRSR